MSHSLIVLPDDTAQPILDALAAAKKSLQIRMFLFTDPALSKAVIAAKRRGVKVRVMLNPARRGGESENDDTKKKLAHEGIEVIDSSPAFDLTHQKSMVIDESIGFVESFNWETKDLTITRDYAVVTTHKVEVEEMDHVFPGGLGPQEFQSRTAFATHLVPEQWSRTHCEFHRFGKTHAVAAERALPGHGDHRTPGPSPPARG